MSTRNRAIVGYGSQANVGSGASNGARSGRRRRANEDDDEEGGEQESGRRRGAASSADIGMSVSELEALISTTTRFVVSHQGKTVQRAEILKFLTEDHSVSKNAFAEIIKGVCLPLFPLFTSFLIDMFCHLFFVDSGGEAPRGDHGLQDGRGGQQQLHALQSLHAGGN